MTTTNYLTYEELQASTERYGETNDCTVKALAQVCSISYEKAHNILRRLGRKGRDGTSMTNVFNAVRGLGYSVEKSKVFGNTIGNSYIPRNKIFLIETSSHVIAAREGKALDYTEGRKHRILEVWEVKKVNEELESFKCVAEQVLHVPRARVQAKWNYTCPHGCEHKFTTTRHNKSQRGSGYRCRKHKAPLTYGRQSSTPPQPSGLPAWLKIEES